VKKVFHDHAKTLRIMTFLSSCGHAVPSLMILAERPRQTTLKTQARARTLQEETRVSVGNQHDGEQLTARRVRSAGSAQREGVPGVQTHGRKARDCRTGKARCAGGRSATWVQ